MPALNAERARRAVERSIGWLKGALRGHPLRPIRVAVPGRVEVGFQPDPVDDHATDVAVADSLGGRGLNPRNQLARPVQAPRRSQRRQPAAQLTP